MNKIEVRPWVRVAVIAPLFWAELAFAAFLGLFWLPGRIFAWATRRPHETWYEFYRCAPARMRGE